MNSSATIQLILLPGIATDRRLFAAQRERFPDLITPDWPIDSNDCRDASEFARRCLDSWTVGTNRVIDSDRPFIIGGSSIGGIIASEIGWLTSNMGQPPVAVLLLSSCRSWKAVPRWYGRWAPTGRQSYRAGLRANCSCVDTLHNHFAAKVLTLKSRNSWRLCISRPNGTRVGEFFARLLATWRREESEVNSAPFAIHQLHGRLDMLLPKPSAKHATLLLDAGHWMTATHPKSVNNWIEAIVRDVSLKRRGPKPVSG